MILAFVISFIIIFCGFIYASIFMFKNWKTISYELAIIYFFIVYTAGVHTPFSVQARYTVPIHLCLLILLSLVRLEGVEPSSRVYETPALTIKLQAHKKLKAVI